MVEKIVLLYNTLSRTLKGLVIMPYKGEIEQWYIENGRNQSSAQA